MNAIVLSAVWGIVMMFSGVFTTSKTAVRNLAVLGLAVLLVANYADWLFTKGDDFHAPDARPNVAAMQKNLDIQKELGLLKIDIDVKAHTDLSMIDEASARLR